MPSTRRIGSSRRALVSTTLITAGLMTACVLPWIALARAAGGHGAGRGRGTGRVVALLLQPCEYQTIDPGPASDAVSAEGLGATTLQLRTRLTASHEARVQTGIVFWTRIPGSAASPDTRVLEAGLALPGAVRLDPATLLGASASVQSVGGIVSQGRFLDGSATIGISRAVGDAVDLWCEVEGVWYGESPGARLVTANAGVTLDLSDHLAVTLGVAGGSAAGTRDSGMVASLRVHS